jgi:chitodextrinase
VIDEAQVYNRALSATEISDMMAHPLVPPVPDNIAPTTPAGLNATGGAGVVNLAWTASTDNVAVTGYAVERCQGTGCTNFAQVGTASGVTFNDTGLAATTSYSYRVRATDAAGNFSGYSNTASAMTTSAPDTTAPSAPSGLAATVAGQTQINLAWTASTDNVGVTEYRIERCQGASCTSWAQVATSPTTSFASTGLTANTAYRFRVRAADAAGNLSAYSNIVSATTQGADTTKPSAPTGLTATPAGPDPDQPGLDARRPTTSASPATGSSGARAPAAPTTPRSRSRPDCPSTTPAGRRAPSTATGCGRPTPPATSATTRPWSTRPPRPCRTPHRRPCRAG